MRVVLDTNIVVSALITPEGVSAKIIDLWVQGKFELLVGDELLDEIKAVLRRPYFVQKLSRPTIGSLINQLRDGGNWIDNIPVIVRSPDSKDDYLLGICEAGAADILVTGDKSGLLVLETHGRTQIITARAFLDRLQS
jgi:uncharacterized protein